jgi:undecaprenyl-diphosphatase
MDELLVALVVGVLQGVFEWLPISSEGNITLYLTVVEGRAASAAVGYALFLHLGTALAATVFYRADIAAVIRDLPAWRPGEAFESYADLSFLVAATLASGVTGIASYLVLEGLASELAGGAFVVLVGVLLVLTGVLQRVASASLGNRESPTPVDAVLVGGLQGLAILPGISRSGTTVGALLLRGYDAQAAFRLSFLLSVPAALGASALVLLDDGVPGLGFAPALVAVGASAVVGYLAIDALVRLAQRVAFWGVCVGLGALAIVGGLLVLGL